MAHQRPSLCAAAWGAGMTPFRPRMVAARQGISVVGGPLTHASEIGLIEIWRARFEEGARGEYVSRDPRLFVVIEEPRAEIAFDGGGGVGRAASRGLSATYVPPGVALSMTADGATEVRHLDVHFDIDRLGPIDGLDPTSVERPRLMFLDARVQRFARLIERACGEAGGAPGLYGDGLLAALVAATFAHVGAEARRSALSDRQLRLALDYIEARCADTIRLAELANLTGLSETYFSHAFKAATGMPPHRWQLQARVREAKRLVGLGEASLSDIASALGFSDQAHFTRVFRDLAGCTPTAWRRMR
ncbi:helix-turn-helix domain-containing protein [Chenggangzhangella methanolivorans]|uniref:AraC family transcriptional regulator n=1 Tax=Chenggangzhangella methanolivorans TaxID=1437009 RepID=A0A9E6R6G5_9HYPH|nr:AraC family transcriptional regulator [Chenggangzhangella methanolivorans]QZN98798.1 AraC family transcriptional regulator [Chenggangzhangella methanolivorans]